MTYIDMVNNLLKRLREREVTTVNENTYSKLIATLINDAKEEVENAWLWSALRTTVTATTVDGTWSYELENTQNRFTMLDVLNDTNNSWMYYQTASKFNDWFNRDNVPTGAPEYYSYNGISADGDTLVEVYPIPDATYTLRFNMVLRPENLSTDADELTIPVQPVLLLAYAKAIEERGEDGGVHSSSAYAQAYRALGDAIALDAHKHPEELLWQNP